MSVGERMEVLRIAKTLHDTFDACRKGGRKERIAARCARELEFVAGRGES